MALRNTLFLFVVLYITCVDKGHAQVFSVGPASSFEINRTRIADRDEYPNLQPRFQLGYSGGLAVNVPLKDNYSLETELYYQWSGRAVEIKNLDWMNRSRYQFIHMPILLRKGFDIVFIKGVPSTWFINVGPDIKYWSGGNGTITTAEGTFRDYTIRYNQEPDGNFNYMYINDVNRWLLGLNFGVGFHIDVIKGHKLFTEVRYLHGHTYLGEPDSAYINILGFEDNMKSNYRNLSLHLSYQIEINILKVQQSQNLKRAKNPKKSRSKS